ncbi:hypothetical protein LBMAG53_11210 [Planctomycetota bacterium]|nr:hypothetical protein LBMAG53_11210 [Planctomycetota bacterium]
MTAERRRWLLVGGSPRIAVDAVRFLQARGSGATARRLRELLAESGIPSDLLLSDPAEGATVYGDRSDLDQAVRRWIGSNPTGGIALSAAINDWQVASVDVERDGVATPITRDDKAPSAATALSIRLVPAPKLIDALRGWGHTGPLIGFKYEAAATVIGSAQALLSRTGASAVVANSLSGTVQALVDAQGVRRFTDRSELLAALAERMSAIA